MLRQPASNNLLIRIHLKNGRYTYPEAHFLEITVVETRGCFQSEYSEHVVEGVAHLVVMRRVLGFEVVEENILLYTCKAYLRNLGEQELAELVMRVTREITAPGAVLIVIEQAESTSRFKAAQDGAVAVEMLVIHEVEAVAVQEGATSKLKLKFTAHPK